MPRPRPRPRLLGNRWVPRAGARPVVPGTAAGVFRTAELRGCPAGVAMTARGLPPARVARALEATVQDGQSPTAIARGVTFARQLTADRCARLLTVLRRDAGWPGERDVVVLDLDRALPMPARQRGASLPTR